MKGTTRRVLSLALVVASACLAAGAPPAEHPEPRAELLALALDTASAIPVEPHLKDRSRAQAAVVETWLEVGDPKAALAAAERIDNWRRGLSYAEIAAFRASHGDADGAKLLCQRASQVADTTEDWRRDRIRVQVARVHALLGDDATAKEFEAGVAPSESGKVAGVRAARDGAPELKVQLEAIRRLAAEGGFDELRNALEACTEAYTRLYGEVEIRRSIEETMRSSWAKIPAPVRVELLLAMGTAASKAGDQAHALELAKEGQAFLDGVRLPLEDRLPLLARLLALRALAGDATARAEADAALAAYRSGRDQVVDIYRARAIRPLAETYASMGDAAAALAAYRLAIEDGTDNPNARPRAEDLAATCCSMARVGVEPDAALWARIKEIRGGLVSPW